MGMTREEVAELDEEALLLDGLDEAIIGTATRCGQPLLVVYSRAKLVKVLMKRDKLSWEEAEEHIDVNIVGAWMGERTPIVVEDGGVPSLELPEPRPSASA